MTAGGLSFLDLPPSLRRCSSVSLVSTLARVSGGGKAPGFSEVGSLEVGADLSNPSHRKTFLANRSYRTKAMVTPGPKVLSDAAFTCMAASVENLNFCAIIPV